MTGKTPLLPRYALGNWWSRYWRYTEESYLSLIEQFKDENFSLSVSVIDMDWHLTEVPERFGNG
ncbi:TIM-barrel domain-containing protein [Enterococcus casseliflavus]|uniref:TIM-barrel domain-containing protein n=1 Tax=Enterococcus casseliflavus TaxID=37734 RepID=UPI001CE02EA3|nr:TIM-barrel domain-containing protein [Enterococcus casseliflavus]